MSTEEKKLIDVVFGRDATRQTSVINPDASIEGRRYDHHHFKEGTLGVTLTIDRRAMRDKQMTTGQLISLQRILLHMAANILEHDSQELSVSGEAESGFVRVPQPEPEIVESGDEKPPISVHDLIDVIEDSTLETVEQLLQCGHISQEEKAFAIAYANDNHVSVLEALQRLKFASEANIAKAIAEQAHVPFVDLDDMEIDPMIIASVSKNLAVEERIIPIHLKPGVIIVAAADRMDFFALDNLNFVLNAHVEQVLV